MRTANIDSNYRMPLKVSGRRRKGEGDASSWLNSGLHNTEHVSGSGNTWIPHHTLGTGWDNIPVEIQAEDSVSYVRLLTEEALVHDVTAEIASHFGSARFVWSLDENRLSVTAEIEGAPNRQQHGEIRWPTEAELSVSDDEGDMTRRVVNTEDGQSHSNRDFVSARIPPLIKNTRPGNETILPPPPSGLTMQPVLALQSVLPDTERNDAYRAHGYSLQTVRTSMPPSHARPERSEAIEVIKIMSVTTLSVAAIMFMLSTPLHRQPGANNDSSQKLLSSTEPPQVMPQGAQLLSVPAAAIAVSDGTMNATSPAAIPATIPAMHFSSQEVAAAGSLQSEESAREDEAAAQKRERHGHGKRVYKARRISKAEAASGAGASDKKGTHAVVINSPTVEQLPGAAGHPSSEPVRLSRKAVHVAMQQISHRVAQCRTTVSGRMDVRMTFAGATGRLVAARVVDDTFRDTPAADCALRAVRNVQMPTFSQESIKIKYPFYL